MSRVTNALAAVELIPIPVAVALEQEPPPARRRPPPKQRAQRPPPTPQPR